MGIVLPLFFLFIVSQAEGWDEDINLFFHPNILAVDPSICTDGEDMDSFMPRREQTDKELPSRSAPAPALAVPPDQDEMIVYLLNIHHLLTGILKSLGVDSCKEYEQIKIDNILSRVQPGSKTCGFCSRVFYNTQKLKYHIRRKHLGETSYKCQQCNKFFGDSSTPKFHVRKPASAGPTFECEQCGKRYLSIGKLNEHR